MKITLPIFTIFILFVCRAYGQAPPWVWAQDATSSGQEYGWDVATDTLSDMVYIGGTFDGNLSAKYGASFTSSYGQDDGFLTKYTINGVFQWALKIGGTTNDQVKSVAVDPAGDIYVCGYFTGTADFDPSGATFNLTAAAVKDGFLAKYSPGGTFLWAVKFGGGGDDEPWKMHADANGIYMTGSYANAPVTFYSYSSGVTKVTTSGNSTGEMFGVKYNSSGVAQWAISGGGSKIDCGYNVVADANNAYFIGRYDEDIIFRNSSGVASTLLQSQQNNEQQVFIIAYTQSAGNFVWQTNITCNSGGKDVMGWGIAQDASNLYVTGQLEDDINFKYPSPTLTQTHTGGGSFDIFLAQLSKTGTFTWRAAVTGSGAGEQIGRAVEVDHSGNVILTGHFMGNLNYSTAGGPTLAASAKDIYVTSYSNAGTFQWAAKAGTTGDDLVYGLSVDNAGGIYITGDQDNGAVFGAYTVTDGGGDNIYVAKIGCNELENNTITANQTICSGNTPSSLTGSLPTGSGPYTYVWEKSPDNSTWTNATGTYTNQNYSPPSLTANTYYRRKVIVTGTCASSLISSSILIDVDALPTNANAGITQTLCASSATLNANTPATGTGLWSVITGTGSVTTPNSSSTSVTALSNGTNRFVWTISNGVCPASSSTVTVMRDVPPTVSNSGTSQTLCTSSATLNANSPATGTGLWSVASGTGSVSNTALNSSSVTGLSFGSNQFVWTISNGTCPSSSSTVTINRDIPPTVSNAGVSQTLCASSATLNSNTPATGTGLWSVLSGTASVSNTTLNNSAVTGLSFGSNQFVWTISNGVCPSSSSTVTVNRDIPPTISNAGTSQTLCASSATLNANVPTTGSGVWSVLTGTGSVSNTTNNNSPVMGLSFGSNQFVWTISNGTCPVSSSTITINRDIPPTVSNAGIPQTLCASSATLNANVPIIGTGIWSVLTGTGSVSNTSINNSPVTGLSNGSNQFLWTISNGVCPSSTGTVTVMRDSLPSISNASSSQTLCASSVTLNANVPTTGTGIWSVLTGTGSVSNTTNNNSPVTGLSFGSNQFVWTISNGTCPSSASTVTINRDIPPTVSNAGASQTLCSSSATLSANSPLTGSGTWSVLSGTASVSNTSINNSPVTGLSNGSNQFVWTISNGVCPSSSSTVTVMRDSLPTISNAGTLQTVCTAGTNLSANIPVTGAGIWSVISGTAVVSDPDLNNSPVTGLSFGSNQFVWTISNGTCPSSTGTVTIDRDISPTISNAGTSQTLCASSATLNANVPTIGSGVWTVLTGTGSVSNTSINNPPVTGLSNGSNQFMWTISNGVCPSSTSTVIVIRDSLPTISNAGSSQTLCSTTSTLLANTPVTGTGLWSVIAGSGSVINANSASTSVTGLNDGSNQFVWTISNGTCPSSTSTVSITKDASPTISNAGISQTLCASSATLNANIPTVGTGSWSVLSGTSSVSNFTNNSSPVTGLSNGNNQFVWTISNGVCPSSTSTVTVMRDSLPSVSNAGISYTICASTTTLSANTPTTGVGLWSVTTGSATVVNLNAPSTTITGLNNGLNEFVWTISNGTCPSSTSTVSITKDASPDIPFAGSDQTICSSSATLNASPISIGLAQWSVLVGSGTVNNLFSETSAVNGLSIGVNKFVWITFNGICPSLTDTVIIIQDEMPTLALAGPDKTICSSTDNLSGNIPAVGLGMWTVSSGSSAVTNINLPSSAVSNLAIGINGFVWSISNGVCPVSKDTTTILVDAFPTTADAGSDKNICSDTYVMEGNTISVGSGSWSLISGSATITNTTANNSTITGLVIGTNTFRWTTQNGVCPTTFDEVTIVRDAFPDVANAGVDIESENPVAQLQAITPVVGSGSWSVVEGYGIIDNASQSSISVSNLSTGNNIFRWTVSNGVCAASTDDIIVYLKPLKIPNAFSPNEDDINDRFVVPGLEYYNDVRFTVFNRWSALVYESNNYKNEWAGSNLNNEPLTDDTYYYTLQIPSIEMEFKGFIIIKRTK